MSDEWPDINIKSHTPEVYEYLVNHYKNQPEDFCSLGGKSHRMVRLIDEKTDNYSGIQRGCIDCGIVVGWGFEKIR